MPTKLDPEERKRRAAARYKKWAAEHPEWKRAYHKAYVQNPEARARCRAASKRWRMKNREAYNAKRRASRNGDRGREQGRLWHASARQRAIERLGGRCIRCGFSDERALEFDHRTPLLRSKGRRKPVWEVLALENPAEVFDLLCANCHTIKTKEGREHWAAKRKAEPSHVTH